MTPSSRSTASGKSRSKPAPDARKLLASLFKGKKAKWLPLFQRLLARLAQLPTIEAIPMRGSIALVGVGGTTPPVGNVKVTEDGLVLGLALAKAAIKPGRLKRSTTPPKRISHCVSLTEPSDIDTELMAWLKAALAGARKHRSD